ncbi:hypothetical protein DOTSEDRAFT_22269 [Dothistroma septosporum NZE10]|uniref:Uncharacterized protein n=1 Tax=Dothistroma septosporum (strain NZE10 / CBS 128990) TaxID=675120 RepID=N1PUT2_DOTSN|nr:hypothetical protein DOTSEDRAFT_22269 [Dothistroma septosporum NZE10]
MRLRSFEKVANSQLPDAADLQKSRNWWYAHVSAHRGSYMEKSDDPLVVKICERVQYKEVGKWGTPKAQQGLWKLLQFGNAGLQSDHGFGADAEAMVDDMVILLNWADAERGRNWTEDDVYEEDLVKSAIAKGMEKLENK